MYGFSDQFRFKARHGHNGAAIQQGGGEVSGLDQGRETTSPDPTERCGEPAVTVDNSAELDSVLQTSHLPGFTKSYTGPMACEERSFTDLVTLGCGGVS